MYWFFCLLLFFDLKNDRQVVKEAYSVFDSLMMALDNISGQSSISQVVAGSNMQLSSVKGILSSTIIFRQLPYRREKKEKEYYGVEMKRVAIQKNLCGIPSCCG